MRWGVAVAVLLWQCLGGALSANILAICVVVSHSHSLWCYQWMAALAVRGHQVTVLGVEEPGVFGITVPNVKTYIVEGVYDVTFSDEAGQGWASNSRLSTLLSMGVSYNGWDKSASQIILHSKALKRLIHDYSNKTKPFDLIIHDHINADALMGLVPLFGDPPLVFGTTFGTPQWLPFTAGNVWNPAYVPSMITSGGQHMSFLQRCLNTFKYVFLECSRRFDIEPFQDRLMREVFGDHLPHVRDISKRANIVVVNHHFAFHDPRPFLPGVLGIAGLHIAEPKPLPKDIKHFMDGAEHGVILFSLGSNVQPGWIPRDFEVVILEALRQVPQRVLWKWDKVLPNLPPNIKMSTWLPVADMLVHPKMRLFVTHCGLLSTQEGVFRKVPILAIPIFVDQFEIAADMERRNITIQLDVTKVTADELRDAMGEIISNPKYKENIAWLGNLMQDMPLTASEEAVFWTEYAIRHQGAPHLRAAAADMPWYQLLLLDVIAAFLLCALALLWLIKYYLLFVYRMVYAGKSKTD